MFINIYIDNFLQSLYYQITIDQKKIGVEKNLKKIYFEENIKWNFYNILNKLQEPNKKKFLIYINFFL